MKDKELKKPASDDFELEWKRYVDSKGGGAITINVKDVARHFAEWQKQQSKYDIKWKKREEKGYEGENGLCQIAPFGYVVYDETHYIPLDDLKKLPRE